MSETIPLPVKAELRQVVIHVYATSEYNYQSPEIENTDFSTFI